MQDRMLENFKLYWDVEYEQMVRYFEMSPFELVVELHNGNIIIYDDISKGVRLIVKDSAAMTDIEWRRMFGYRLRSMIHRKGMTQAEFAAKVGLTQGMISNYIRGRFVPNLYMTHKFAQVLDCSVIDFLTI